MKSKYLLGFAALVAITILLFLLPDDPEPEIPVAPVQEAEVPPERAPLPVIPTPDTDATAPPQVQVPANEAPVPHLVEPEMNPELPPEQTLESRIEQQEAMLTALQRHIESRETKWRAATSESDRQFLESQIRVLREEHDRQQAELDRLRQTAP